jgi:Protein of unknown function (DUF3307)
MILLSLILAHLVGDFYLQTDEMAKNKEKTLRLHIFHHFICLLIVTMAYWLWQSGSTDIFHYVCYPILFILIFHCLIDYLKIIFSKSNKIRKILGEYAETKLFLLDQLFHIGIIMITGALFYNIPIQVLVEKITLIIQSDTSLGTLNTLLFLLIILILTTTFSGHVVKKVVGHLPNDISTFEGQLSIKMDETNLTSPRTQRVSEEYHYTLYNINRYNRGEIIGYIERVIVLILTYYSAYPAIGFIIAAKSIARFKLMEERSWAEYFLLGTILSMLLGISLGVITRLVLH